MAPTRDAVPNKGRLGIARFGKQRRPSVSVPDGTSIEMIDMSHANISDVSLVDQSSDNRSDLSTSTSGSWRRKTPSGKPLLFKPPSLRFRGRPEIERPWRRSNEQSYLSGDESHDSDNESKYSFDTQSTVTNATSVASSDEDYYPPKTDTTTTARPRPSITFAPLPQSISQEKQVVKRASAPVAPAKPAKLRGARIDIAAPVKKTLHIEIKAPPAPAALPAPPSVPRITHDELRERERVEEDLLKEISRMRDETKGLLGRQSVTDRRLEDALDRLGILHSDKERAERQRNEALESLKTLSADKGMVEKLHKEEQKLNDRITRDLDRISSDLEVQLRLLDDANSLLHEHEKNLEGVRKERDELRDVAAELEAKSTELEAKTSELGSKSNELAARFTELESKSSELEQTLASERDAKNEISSKYATLENDFAEQKKEREHFEARCSNLEKDLGDLGAVTKETERALIERIAAAELTRDALRIRVASLETNLIKKGTELGDVTSERDLLCMELDRYKPQVDSLLKENGGLTEANKNLQARIDELDGQKKGLEASVEQLETEKKDIQDRFNAIEVEKQDIEVRFTELGTANTDLQTRFESLEITKGELEIGKAELDTRVKDLEGVQAKYDKLQTRIDTMKERNATLKEQVQGLLSDQDDHTSQILRLFDERIGLQSEIGSLKDENASLAGENASLIDENASLKDENESVTSELRRAESLMGSAAPSIAPSVISESDAGSDAGTVKADDDAAPAPPAPEDAPPAPPVEEVIIVEEEIKDDAKSVAPSQVDRAMPEVEAEPVPAPEAEAEPAPEKAESVASSAPEPAVMEELRQNIAELQTRNDQLQEETVKLGSLTAERDELAARVANLEPQREGLNARIAELEPEANQAPVLRQENLSLTAQLGAVNAQLDGLRATYEATVAEVVGLQQQIKSLRGRVASPSGESKKSSSRTKTKDNDKKKEQLVVIRDPNERGRIQVIRRSDLRAMRSSSQSEGDKSD
ncbi:RNA polymerase rpb1 c-terminal repeat domain-containing protein [Colletotrichum kahawae]|uniref:RNA polymerase rpb1 c-terminal repeat domain-containing protein n=1 Tax=Colletotrichum kahawae TaxID=34407 RepID=A0AAD9Y189_COLKA|nr:RNA polymerase rpb1 c-terminal repeat domain-containing protein [Colletotrichum kahawae]